MWKKKISRPATRRDFETTLFGIALGTTALFFCSTRGYPTSAVLFSGLFLQPFCVTLHELGHAWAYSLVGGGVRYIQLGRQRPNRPPRRVRFLGYTWLIHSLPFCGLVMGDIFTAKFYRLKDFLVIAAGPIMNALLLAIGWIMADHVTSEGWSCASVGLMLTNASLLFYSVIPRDLPPGSIAPYNDGMLLARILRSTDEEIKIRVAQAEIAMHFMMEARELEGLSLSDLVAKCDGDPGSLAALWHTAVQLHQADDSRYDDIVPKLIAHPQLSKKQMPLVIDEYLTWQLHHGPPARPDVADRLSAQLIEMENTISTRGTRGSVLVNIGQISAGKALLEEVLAKSKSDIDRIYSNVFLALAFKADGNIELARDHAHAASKVMPNSPVLARVSDLLKD